MTTKLSEVHCKMPEETERAMQVSDGKGTIFRLFYSLHGLTEFESAWLAYMETWICPLHLPCSGENAQRENTTLLGHS